MNNEKQLVKISKNIAKDETLFAIYSKGGSCMDIIAGDLERIIHSIFFAM